MSKIWRRSLAGLAIGLAAQGVQAAPVVQPIASFGGSEYARVDDSAQVSWTAASAAVAAMGGGWHLATITTAAENTFVETTVLGAGAADRSHYWIGATDAAVEGTFAWVTGEPFSFADWGAGSRTISGTRITSPTITGLASDGSGTMRPTTSRAVIRTSGRAT